MKKLFLLRGLPGSGKSTLAKTLSSTLTGHVETDMFFINHNGEYKFDASKLKDAHDWCIVQVEGYMQPYGFDTIVVSNTFTEDWEMKPYYELAECYGYVVFSLIVENRHGGSTIHDIDNETLEHMRNQFEISL